MNSWYHVIIYTLYTLAGAIRLGYFNIIAMDDKEGPVSHYSGLPVTSVAIILPLFYLLRSILMFETFKIVYIILLLLIAILFVSNFKLKKPTGRVLYIFLVLGLVGIILLLGLCI